MTAVQYFFSNFLYLKIFITICVLKMQILECRGNCNLVNPTAKEKKLLDVLKPLYGHT